MKIDTFCEQSTIDTLNGNCDANMPIHIITIHKGGNANEDVHYWNNENK